MAQGFAGDVLPAYGICGVGLKVARIQGPPQPAPGPWPGMQGAQLEDL